MKFKKEYKNLNKFIKEFKSGLIWVNSEMIEKALELIKENLNDELYNIPCQVEYKSDWCYYKRG
jgi:bifunctional N-acetylglucosamine-1-phosphate-uridyltransferase/glucosamine-1-phosphate-acetyltransferase GlmU-like protein